MLRFLRDLPIKPSEPTGLRFVDRGWVGCPATAPRDVSIEACLACPQLTATLTQGGTIQAIRCQPRLSSRVA